MAPGPGKLQLVYTPAEGGAPVTMNVYDFKGKGVAMAMYNTDDVRATVCSYSDVEADIAYIVNTRICPLFVQDGVVQEDAPRMFFVNHYCTQSC